MDDVRNQCFSDTSLDCLAACRRSPVQRSSSDGSPPRYPAAPHPSPVHTQDQSERGSRFHLEFQRTYLRYSDVFLPSEISGHELGNGHSRNGDGNKPSEVGNSFVCGEEASGLNNDGNINKPSEVGNSFVCGEEASGLNNDGNINKPSEVGNNCGEASGLSYDGNINKPSEVVKSDFCKEVRIDGPGSPIRKLDMFEEEDWWTWNVNSPRKPKSPIAEFLSWRKNKESRGKRFSCADLGSANPSKNKNNDLDFLNTI